MGGYTLEFLASAGPKYAMQYLLPRIRARTNMTYGEIAERLARDLRIEGKIFPPHVGHVAGPLQDRIHEVEPDAPLLNVLIVRADSDEASHGVDGYLAEKYGVSSRRRLGRHAKSALLQRAAEDVYAYGRWPEIFKRAFNEAPPLGEPIDEVTGEEQDGKSPGGPGESEEHKRLKMLVFENPAIVGARGRIVEKKQEYFLLSGDEVDVFISKKNEFWLVEVKSERSNGRDLLKGCYQAIKYRAVFQAQIRRTLPSALVHTVLVTRAPLPPDGKALTGDHNIIHVDVGRKGGRRRVDRADRLGQDSYSR